MNIDNKKRYVLYQTFLKITTSRNDVPLLGNPLYSLFLVKSEIDLFEIDIKHCLKE